MGDMAKDIKQERFNAAQIFLDKFPSQDAAAKALGFDGRATASNWIRIGMPIRVVLVADALGYFRKEDVVPSVPDWAWYEKHHADYVSQQIEKVLRAEERMEEQAGIMSDVLRPVIRLEIGHALQILGIINDSNKQVFAEGGFVHDDEEDASEGLNSLLE